MAKVAPPRRKRAQQRNTNWVLIGAIGAIGVVGLFALLFVTLQSEGVPTPTVEPVPLAEYCEDNPANCVEKGPADAPVTVVEISDYGCPHCKNFNSGTAQALDEAYVESGDVRWIVMPFALSANTRPAAEAALCAADQDAFFEFHEEMFVIQGTSAAMTRDGFVEAADGLGLDTDDFENCYDSGRYRSVVQQNMTMASAAGVSATPTFFINGIPLEGNQPLNVFEQELARALNS